MSNKGNKVVLWLKDDEVAIVIKKSRYYRLGYPVLDIVLGSTIIESAEVHWCEMEQNWMDND